MRYFVLRIVLLVLCLTFGAALGCGGASDSEEVGEQSEVEPVGEYMRDHFEQVRGVQVGVIRGHLDAVKAAAKWVATREALEGMPESWQPFIDQMRSAADEAIAAPDIAAAAEATAAMGSTCAACHEAMQHYPQFLAVAPPPESDETVPHMIGHMWAADRMWKGLVSPSAKVWADGVGALAGDPLDGGSIVPEVEDPGRLAALAAKVHDLAAQGRSAAEVDSRAKIYGEFLATCAECHQLLGVGNVQ